MLEEDVAMIIMLKFSLKDDDSDEDPDYVPENLNVVEEQMTEYIRDIESALSAPSQISNRRKTNNLEREKIIQENDENVSKVLSKETDSRIYERFQMSRT
uniref:Uncharacterized protein n=1 Tax=Cacopsylla melanoneura TaxID=428564 RepID=A0A8D8V797_9HEMI